MKSAYSTIFIGIVILTASVCCQEAKSQSTEYKIITISDEISYQTMEGFGGALAYYESWLTDHPNKVEIYEALFDELSLDILRVRTAYDYDDGMINRVKEFMNYAESIRDKPIDLLATSWGPPKYLKSNNNRKDGGTLKYEKTPSGITFDYAGFAHWWNKALDEYNDNGVYPTYISIQNEPDFTADWESCILRPSELITATDTAAGYNKALVEVYDSVQTRTHIPKFLGPECVGIGYNSVENYGKAMDLSLLHGIGHHLYHGFTEGNPYASTDFEKVGKFHPEIPHFQTEFSGGDWKSLIGQVYKSLNDEHVVAYFYWDLFWPNAGLIDTDEPWNRNSWSNSKGFKKTKDFYVFKQYAAFIHPGWTMIDTDIEGDETKGITFMSPDKDSAALVIINTSDVNTLQTAITIPGYKIDKAASYITSASQNCELISESTNTILEVPVQSIITVALELSETTDILVESIELLPSEAAIESRMDSISISAEITPGTATNKTLFWQIISGEELATLSQSGVLKALGTGDGIVTVKASAIDGSNSSATLEVEISRQILVESINLTASAGKITTPEGSIQFTATVLPEEAYNKEVDWEIVSGSEIATLSQEGLLQALGVQDGSVTIKASSTDGSEVSKELTISVSNQVTAVTMQASNALKVWSDRRIVYYELPVQQSSSSLNLISLSGQICYSEIVPPGAGSGYIPLSKIHPGIYILNITNSGFTSSAGVILY